MGVNGKPQTLAEYNEDLERGSAEIDAGEFITAEDLKLEAKTWSSPNAKVSPGFNQELCWALMFHLTDLFAKSEDPFLSGFGVMV